MIHIQSLIDDAKCFETVRALRWPDGVRCAGCDSSRERLQALLHQSPRTYGQPTSRWTLALAAEISFAQGLIPRQVSGETIRMAFKQLGVRWKRAKHWITSPDPAYLRKKNGATA
jgi:Transposase zinc-ribbon domain